MLLPIRRAVDNIKINERAVATVWRNQHATTHRESRRQWQNERAAATVSRTQHATTYGERRRQRLAAEPLWKCLYEAVKRAAGAIFSAISVNKTGFPMENCDFLRRFSIFFAAARLIHRFYEPFGLLRQPFGPPAPLPSPIWPPEPLSPLISVRPALSPLIWMTPPHPPWVHHLLRGSKSACVSGSQRT